VLGQSKLIACILCALIVYWQMNVPNYYTGSPSTALTRAAASSHDDPEEVDRLSCEQLGSITVNLMSRTFRVHMPMRHVR